ncbi:hypothetical protein DNTS_017107 [Danionella cerebrum]|uniref:Equilibrative nucleoside transporter 4 n=1 Tax=Danionella cerebrum TaxID=2873325 RepID=A0A553NG37_9TELE|nr:hypothetical protein DNTS_017107 [Danionella translucida]
MYSEEWSRNEEGRQKTVITNFSFSQLPDEEKPGRNRAYSAHDSEVSIPDDRYHGIYFAMLLAGVGFLLPYNSFITDVDYLHGKFPGTSIVFDMSLTYILVALSAVIVNNALVERLSLNTRICVGYLFALGPLVFVCVFDIWLELFNTHQAYGITLASVAIVAFGCTVQQSSFYGYTGMLPKRYTQGVMTGESTAGVLVSLSRIFTKLLVENEKNNTIIFFLFSVSMETLCFLLHVVVRQTSFVRYHTSRAQLSHGCLKGQILNASTLKNCGYQIHYDSSAEDEDGVVSSTVDEADAVHLGNSSHGDGIYVRFDMPKPDNKRTWISVKELRNDTLGEWLPILTMALFNMADFVGKILAACPYEWGSVQLLLCSCLRVLFLPLFVMCVSPAQHPRLAHPAWPCALSLMLGNTMTVSYMAGLMLGSVVSYSTYSLSSQGHSPHPLKLNTTLTLESYIPGH